MRVRLAQDGNGWIGMSERMMQIGDVELCVDSFGAPGDPAVLLIMGAAASMLWWEDELCARIAAQHRFVIRYDNRDTGRSSCYPPGEPAYSFTDLAQDAIGILDALDVPRAHVVCRSWSGGIGLIIGVDHRDRVASLTFESSSTGADGLPPPSPELAANRIPDPDPDDRAAVIRFVVAWARACADGSPYFDEDATRALVERDLARTRDIAAMLTNHYAIEFDDPAGGGFADIEAPTLVLHGDLDPVLPLAHGEALRDAIPAARLAVLRGAGHDLPAPLWDEFIRELVRHTGERPPD
jgi:pimeloyl-ACP methyl ester carboxylesterase